LPRHPFDPDAPQTARNIPVIIGSNKDEATLFTMFDPDFGKMTVEQVQQRFAATLGERSSAALDLFRKRRPNDPPTYWFTSMVTSMGAWINSVRLAERKALQGGAPAFMYRLDWETPVLNGTLKAPHGLDTALVFDNADKAAGMSGTGPEPRKIAADMSQAWINFARTGNPSQKGLAWPPYEARSRNTLIFDVPSHVASDPDREVRQFFAA
jgi:para-nitrobenzyl esterase